MNKTVLITAGPTYELIDPVRFIGNFSSGKMGFALAEAFARAGAAVQLVAGPVHLQTRHPAIRRVDVVSADEMFQATSERFNQSDITVFCAAVADFTPKVRSTEKVKRGKDTLRIELQPTRDIAASMGQRKTPDQILVGFALETHNEAFNAQRKLETKNLDMIVLNSLQDEGAGFGHHTNKVTLFTKNGNTRALPLMSKTEVANAIVEQVCLLSQKKA